MNISSFLGIRNTESSRSIPNNALADAVDCDISDAGVITQRNGYVLAKSLTNVTSAYSTMNQDGYVVSNGILYRIFPDLTAIPLAASTATEFTDA